jgi:hypothetical protein
MLMGNLLSLRQFNLPVKMVVFNNGSLGFVELEMKATGFLSHATDLVNPDFAKIAEGAGILGLHVDDPEKARSTLEQAFAHNGPALVDIAVNRRELAMPPSLKLNQIVDFNLYMIKAILNGRGDEIVDLARTNLFRRWMCAFREADAARPDQCEIADSRTMFFRTTLAFRLQHGAVAVADCSGVFHGVAGYRDIRVRSARHF